MISPDIKELINKFIPFEKRNSQRILLEPEDTDGKGTPHIIVYDENEERFIDMGKTDVVVRRSFLTYKAGRKSSPRKHG